jgi:hypothetical protein
LMILLFSTKTDSRVEKEVVFHPWPYVLIL